MLALIRMDWTLLRRLLLPASPAFALVFWLGFTEPRGGGLIMAGYLLALFGMGYPLFHDLGPHTTEPYLCALPVSRGQIVVARYASALAALLIALPLPLALAQVGRQAGLPVPALPLADLGLGLGLVGLLLGGLLFLYLPFHFRFGGERGLGTFALCLTGLLIGLVARAGGPVFLARITQLDFSALERTAFRLQMVGGWMVLGAASLALSWHAYRKRTSATQVPAALPFLLLGTTSAAVALLLR